LYRNNQKINKSMAKFKRLTHKFKRPSHLLLALVLLVAVAIPALRMEKARAYNLITTRSITMSNSSSGTLADGQNVVYKVQFTSVTVAASVGSVVIEFCQNNPIIEDTCSTGTSNSFGFNDNFNTLAFNGAQAGITDLTVNTTNSTANRLVLTRSGGAQAVTAGTGISFALGNGTTNGFTNPTDTNDTTAGQQVGSFFARISTHSSTDGTGAPGTRVDAGGIALSTTQSVTVTSKVQERLQFCVFTSASCAGGGGTVTLGDTNGVLDPAGPYVDKNTKYEILTNASQGADIRIKGGTLKTGTFTIDPSGTPSGSNTTASASAAGTEQFGLCNYTDTSTDPGLTPDTLYNGGGNCSTTSQTAGTGTPGGASTATFAFSQDATLGTTSTYGSVIAHKTPGVLSRGIVSLIGNISLTTEAGVYTTTLNFIATGIY
jgi:hypothetical protein